MFVGPVVLIVTACLDYLAPLLVVLTVTACLDYLAPLRVFSHLRWGCLFRLEQLFAQSHSEDLALTFQKGGPGKGVCGRRAIEVCSCHVLTVSACLDYLAPLACGVDSNGLLGPLRFRLQQAKLAAGIAVSRIDSRQLLVVVSVEM